MVTTSDSTETPEGGVVYSVLRKLSGEVRTDQNTSTVALRLIGGDEKGSWDSVPRMTALATTSSNFKRQIRPLVRESAPHQQTCN
jgi:hypothetical protein